MDYIQILSCNNNLGNCCSDPGLLSFFSITKNILLLIQIIVPILLIIMSAIQLFKMMMNPDDKKGLPSIRNKFIAAAIVFFVPTIVNSLLLMITSSNNNLISCINEASNIKYNKNVTYKKPSEDKRQKSSIVPDSSDYQKGIPKPTQGEEFTSGACKVGDAGVELVPNDSHRHAKVVRKANGEEVANYARSWLGKGLTYKLGASGDLSYGGTCDCSHFVYEVLDHFGILEGGQIRTTVWGSCNVEGTTLYSDYSKLVPGDVVFQYFGNATAHVELYIGNGETIGCNGGIGVTHGHNAGGFDTFIHLSAYD